jgi:hypothetical protein
VTARALLVVAALGVACAGRATPPTPRAVDGPLRAAGLDFFLGTWDIDYHPVGGAPARMVWTVTPWFGGVWYTGEARLGDVIAARDAWSIDAKDGDVVRVYVDSGRSYGVLRGRGWDGARLELEGTLATAQGPVGVRERIERRGDAAMAATWEAQGQDGAFGPLSSETGIRR